MWRDEVTTVEEMGLHKCRCLEKPKKLSTMRANGYVPGTETYSFVFLTHVARSSTLYPSSNRLLQV